MPGRIRSLRGATVKAHLVIDEKSWKEAQQRLRNLVDAARKEVLELAVLAGAEVIRDEANQDAPGPHVEIETKQVTNTNAIAAVGPDKEHWHYRFSELGATPHEISGAPLIFWGDIAQPFVGAVAHATGGTPARPFLRPAMDKKGDAARQAMADVLRREIEKAAK